MRQPARRGKRFVLPDGLGRSAAWILRWTGIVVLASVGLSQILFAVYPPSYGAELSGSERLVRAMIGALLLGVTAAAARRTGGWSRRRNFLHIRGHEATLSLRTRFRSPVRLPLHGITAIRLSTPPVGLTPEVLDVFDHPNIVLRVPASVLSRASWRGRHLRDITALLVGPDRIDLPLEVGDPDAVLDSLVRGGATLAHTADTASTREEPSGPPLPDDLAGRFRASQLRLLWASMAGSVLVPVTFLIGSRAFGARAVELTLALATLVATPTAIAFVSYRRRVREVMLASAKSVAGGVPTRRVEPLDRPMVYRDRRGLRATRIIAWLFTILFSLILLGGVIVASDPGPDPPVGEFIAFGAFATLPWVGYLWQRRIRLVADRYGLTVVTAFGTQTMPWRRIKASFMDGNGLTLLLDDDTQVRSSAITARTKDPRAQRFLTLVLDQAAAHTTGTPPA